jgi:hypothetical protein
VCSFALLPSSRMIANTELEVEIWQLGRWWSAAPTTQKPILTSEIPKFECVGTYSPYHEQKIAVKLIELPAYLQKPIDGRKIRFKFDNVFSELVMHEASIPIKPFQRTIAVEMFWTYSDLLQDGESWQ